MLDLCDCHLRECPHKTVKSSVIRTKIIEELRKISSSDNSVVVIIGTNEPRNYHKFKDAVFDEKGFSSEARGVLEEYLGSDFFLGEINPVCFHGLQKKEY